MMSLKKIASILALSSTISVSLSASATTINFDDLSGFGFITNGYNSLDWNNFYFLNPITYPNSTTLNGYKNGTVSPQNVATNAGGQAASISSINGFTLNDAFFTAAWNHRLNLKAVATDGVNTYIKNFILDTSGPQDIVFNFANITSVTFTSFGGIDAGFGGGGTHFAMDNLTINAPVPEPETYAMLMAGLGVMGFVARRRKNKVA
jgi:hypothetical protein